MTSLEMFYIHFLSSTSRPDTKEFLEPTSKKASLPSLKYFEFHGDGEYLERLSDGIDASVKYIYLTFFNDLEGIIGRTKTPSFEVVETRVYYSGADLSITFSQLEPPRCLGLRITCEQFDWQMTSITDICESVSQLVTLSTVRQLDIYASPPLPDGHDDMDHSRFSELFRKFSSMESLRVTKEIGSHVAHALVGMELARMRDFYVEEQTNSHQRSNLPISLHPWKPSNSSTSPRHAASTRTPLSFIQMNDPSLALEEDIQHTCERFSPRSFAIHSLHQKAQFSSKELENSIEIARNLLDMRPRQLRRVKLLRMLAFCYALRSHEPGDRNKSVAMFEDAFQDESATISERLYRMNTLSALQCALTGAFAVQWQASTIGRLGSKIHIPLDYASYQIARGQLELAVETIEQGKTLIWSDIYGLRTSAGRLRTVNPDLADRLATVSQDLVAVNASILAHRVVGSRLDEEEDHEHLDAFSPMCYYSWAIIIINHCRWRCDILIVLHNKPPSLISTTEGFYDRASTLASTLLDARKKYAVESELYQQELRSILKELYERVGQPVLDRLRELDVKEQTRVWWYPTSVFCSLPLHAMGPVPSTDGREQYFSDKYICSYTPTLGALIAARTPTAPASDRGPTLLFVGRPNESPRGTRDMKVIRSIGVPATRLVFRNASREAVINGLQKHRLAHFACRSHREEGKPFDTALELDGGDRLALLDIVRCRVPTTELAVLSSGRTAELVDGTDFVEGLHLAAAMQFYGFGSVVGTMWDLGDVGGEDLSLGFYKEMLSGGAEDGTPPSERSARALQYMVQKLRETRVTLQRWANWVHYGA
ncbi:CHAT domain-containing protein [Russula vinacea]|nr:CHAT domain-containing protein [Russula vinacea]